MKRIKMCLYGEPGTGKSVFASKAPKPFFICTDGNYEWLEDFGADPEAHVNVNSWEEAKKWFNNEEKFKDYETIVLDLTEDLFKWCEKEFCIRNKIEHPSDIGYGKGYDISRNEFFIEVCKLIAMDKNVIFIMHGLTTTVKDRRGVEHTKYVPSNRLPDKVIDMIEGRVRYFLRCYLKDEELEDGTLIKKRYLSLVPKPDEFGIVRGINENLVPHDIPLDWSEFTRVIGYENQVSDETETPVVVKKTRREKKVTVDNPPEETMETKVIEEKPTEEEEKVPEKVVEIKVPDEPAVTKEETKTYNPEPVTPAPKTNSNDDRIAAIKAKLAALKNK